MLKTVLINQPAGLGDILFCQKIGEHYKSKGHRVIWPVIPEYRYVGDYLKNFEYPVITSSFDGDYFFRNCGRARLKTIEENKDFIFVPLLDISFIENSELKSKYLFMNIDVSDWIDYINIQRNYEKEQSLIKRLELNNNEKYCLVNKWFRSPPNSKKMCNIPETSKKIIELNTLDDYSLFDWIGVIEYADEFFVTDSSLTLLIEKYKTINANKFTILMRQPNIENIRFLYKLDWKYIRGVF